MRLGLSFPASVVRLTPSQMFFCDALRYVSVLTVALHHILGRLGFAGYVEISKNANTNFGCVGVAALFVLSGFLITYTVMRKSAKQGSYDFGTYAIERICRLYVVLLPVMLLAPLIGLGWFPTIFTIDQGSLERWLTNFFMLCDIWPSAKPQAIYFLMIPSWTLNYDFYFYLIFGLVVLPLPAGKPMLVLRIALLTACVLLIAQAQFFWLFAANWLAGAAIAWLHQRKPSIRWHWGLIAAAILLLIFALTQQHFYGAWPYLLTAIIVAMFGFLVLAFGSITVNEEWQKRASVVAGYSYSLYLTHIITLSFIADFYPSIVQFFVNTGGPVTALVVAVLAVNLGAYGFSWVSERHTDRVRAFVLRLFGKEAV